MNDQLKIHVQQLRSKGLTFREIQSRLNVKIPKSSLSFWCKNIVLSKKNQKRIKTLILNSAKKGRGVALVVHRERRLAYLTKLYNCNKILTKFLEDKQIAKLVLATIFWCEGSKTLKGSLAFGNSDGKLVALFCSLLRKVYVVNESRLRATLQCRADQNIPYLNSYWSEITGIPLKQFYLARIDKRTIGKPSKKKEYKGVCRIDYFCADVFNELVAINKVLSDYMGP